jgi:hypothetical protein
VLTVADGAFGVVTVDARAASRENMVVRMCGACEEKYCGCCCHSSRYDGTIAIVARWVAFTFGDDAFASGDIYVLSFVAVVEAVGSASPLQLQLQLSQLQNC